MKLFYALVLVVFINPIFAQTNLDNASKIALKNPELLLNTCEYIPALIQVSSDCKKEYLETFGYKINSQIGNIWSVLIPNNALNNISSIKWIEHAELSTYSNATRFKNDIERQLTKVDKVQNGLQNSLPKNYTGKGVIVGIVDVGFQCNNPSFYTSDGKQTRIVRYWHQGDKSGTAPSGYNYGTEYTDTALIQTLNDMDGTHGTHVAGIAAGSGFSTPGLQYRGMAPDAELVFVTIKYANDTLPGSALGDYVVANPTIIDAYNYIFNYAQSVGKPAVINLSWGMHTGPHDGTSLFDKATELLVGQGKILVGANGNEGDNPMHWNHKFEGDTVSTIVIENNRQFRVPERVYCDFWGSKQQHFSIKLKIIDTNENLICETPFIKSNKDTSITYKFFADTSNFMFHYAVKASYINNQKPNITFWAEHPKQRKYAIIATITSDSSDVHGWNSGAAKEWTSGSFRNKLNKLNFEQTFIAGNGDYTAGENGGTSKAVISVGALAARSSYTNVRGKFVNDSNYVIPPSIAKFSSKGPTVDGRIKPNISAPGYDVPSSLNNKQMADWMLDKTLLKSVFRKDTQYWAAFNGTSMAAPHVTGIVALMLEANPKLNAAQAKDILESTADEDNSTGAIPNNSYGFGRVNAYDALIKTLQTSGINSYNKQQGIGFTPNPANNILNFYNQEEDNASIEILDLQGRSVKSFSLLSKQNSSIDISDIQSGIYIVNITIRGEFFAYKLVKN